MLIFTVTKFGADWLIFVDVREQTSQMQQFFTIQDQITPVVPVQFDLRSNSFKFCWT